MLGEIELQKGDFELARGFLERAAKLDPRNYYVHYSLAARIKSLAAQTTPIANLRCNVR